MNFNAKLDGEIKTLIKRLYEVSTDAKKESQAAFKEAAPLLISAIEGRSPQSDAPHYRYSTPKVAKGIRAPKGLGRIVATYIPGNLKRSFRTLTFRRSASVFVGPKAFKGNPSGIFSGRRVDPYYAHMVEFGTEKQTAQPFVRPAAASAGPAVMRIAAQLLKRQIEKHNNKA